MSKKRLVSVHLNDEQTAFVATYEETRVVLDEVAIVGSVFPGALPNTAVVQYDEVIPFVTDCEFTNLTRRFRREFSEGL